MSRIERLARSRSVSWATLVEVCAGWLTPAGWAGSRVVASIPMKPRVGSSDGMLMWLEFPVYRMPGIVMACKLFAGAQYEIAR